MWVIARESVHGDLGSARCPRHADVKEDESLSYEERKFLEWNGKPELAFEEILEHMDKTIKELLSMLPGPEKMKLGKVVVHRFSEKDAEHAVVLKLAMLVSNLRAGRLLIDHGFTYEWAMIRRLLYETIEDVSFLLAEDQADSTEGLHERYLAAFYAEDLDEDGRLNEKGVHAPSRQEMRSFLETVEEKINRGRPQDGSGLGMLMKAIYRFGSGHMHGRAVSIMRLYDADAGALCMNGMEDKEYLAVQLRSLWTVLFSAILCFAAIRARIWGVEYWNDASEMAKEFAKIARLGVISE